MVEVCMPEVALGEVHIVLWISRAGTGPLSVGDRLDVLYPRRVVEVVLARHLSRRDPGLAAPVLRVVLLKSSGGAEGREVRPVGVLLELLGGVLLHQAPGPDLHLARPHRLPDADGEVRYGCCQLSFRLYGHRGMEEAQVREDGGVQWHYGLLVEELDLVFVEVLQH